MSDTPQQLPPPDQQQPLRVVPLHSLQRPPTPVEAAWSFAAGVALLIIGLVVAGYIGSLCWNNLSEVTGLPEVSFKQALSAATLLYIGRVLTRGK